MACVNHSEVQEGNSQCSRCNREFCADCTVELTGGRFCAECKTEQVKDIKSGVDQSEFVLASIWQRFAAQSIDGLITIGVFAVGGLAGINYFSPTADNSLFSSHNLFTIVAYVSITFYEGIMLQWRGQTLGKIAMKLMVVSPDGKSISKGQAWGRPIVRNILVFLYAVDYLPALFTKQKTCLHDMAAKTRVIKLNV